MGSDWHASAAIVERADPDRFRATMAAPVEARARLFPLYAFNAEVARAPWLTQEALIARMRLQWWRDLLDEIAAGGPVRQHEVSDALGAVLRPDLARLLDDLVVARHWDIDGDGFGDRAALLDHIDRTNGHLTWAAAALLGAADEAVVRDFAKAAGLAAWLRAVAALKAAGKRPLVDESPEGIADLARNGLEHLARARARRALVAPAACPALFAGWMAGPILAQAQSDPARVLSGDLGISDARARAALLWRSMTGRC